MRCIIIVHVGVLPGYGAGSSMKANTLTPLGSMLVLVASLLEQIPVYLRGKMIQAGICKEEKGDPDKVLKYTERGRDMAFR